MVIILSEEEVFHLIGELCLELMVLHVDCLFKHVGKDLSEAHLRMPIFNNVSDFHLRLRGGSRVRFGANLVVLGGSGFEL